MKTQLNEDTQYIELFINGDEKGFEMLVKKYQNRALNIVYSLIGKDKESEDIVQDAFLSVYRNMGSFKQNCQFSTWLYRIVINSTYTFIRKRKRLLGQSDLTDDIPASGLDPQEELLTKEREKRIEKALTKVPIKFRVALILKDIDGLSYREISEVLRCRIGTVESKIYRARQFLKKEYLRSGGNYR